ncbi:MAG: lipocalin family protein [Thermonemataceae bacterium]
MMNKRNMLGLAAVGLLLWSFNFATGPRDLIAKKWKFDIEYLKEVFNKEIEKRKQGDPENVPSEAEIEQGRQMVEMAMGSIVMDFKADGVYSVSAMGQSEEGTWQLSDDGKTLELVTGGKTEKFKIVKLTENEMIWESQAEGEGTELKLIPAE